MVVHQVGAEADHEDAELPLAERAIAVGVALAWLITRKNRGWLIWLITLVVGLIIWGFYRDKLPHWSFVIVASSMSALLMLGWRGVVALAQKRR